MSHIHINGLTFAYEGSYDTIFENVTLHLDTRWRLGLIGRNGRGKTTLLRLLAGELPHGGSIRAETAFGYFPYPVSDPGQSAARVVRQICPGYEDWELLREMGALEVEEAALERPFSTLSGGERTKLLLAAMFLGENRFLLIDEPTNHLDLNGRELVSRYLRKKSGFILVSHDRAFLDGCVDHVLAINKADIQLRKGNFSSWWENKRRQDQFELEKNIRLKKEIRRLGETARQKADWSDKVEKTKTGTKNSGSKPDRGYIGHKSAKMMKRAKVIEARQADAAEEKAGLLKNLDEAEPLRLWPLSYHAGRLAALERLCVYYGDRRVCGEVSFSVNRGDRIALIGANGTGKSSILKLLCGEAAPGGGLRYTGELYKASGLIISRIPQDTTFLQGGLREYARENGLDESLLKTILRKLDFSRTQMEKNMEDLSQGQRKKVLLAASLCERAHLYVWDEPLNYIDLLSRLQLEEVLLAWAPTLLFVEHDRLFCQNIATRQVAL